MKSDDLITESPNLGLVQYRLLLQSPRLGEGSFSRMELLRVVQEDIDIACVDHADGIRVPLLRCFDRCPENALTTSCSITIYLV